MARFGGTIMRGLAGALGGYNQGMEEEALRRQREEELKIRQAAEARQLAQDKAQQANWDTNTRVNLRNEGYEQQEALQPLPAGTFAPTIGGGGVDLSSVYDAALKKRLAGPTEEVGGVRFYAPGESKIKREERQKEKERKEKERVDKELAALKAKADLLEAQVRARAQSGERQTLAMKAAQDDLTARRTERKGAETAHSQFMRARQAMGFVPSAQRPGITADSTRVVQEKDAAVQAEREAEGVRNQLFGVRPSTSAMDREITDLQRTAEQIKALPHNAGKGAEIDAALAADIADVQQRYGARK